jgi:transposase
VDPRKPPALRRDKLRYLSDLTDADIGPLPPPAKRGGGERTVDMREVVNGVMCVLSTGCQWRYLPKDLPPRAYNRHQRLAIGYARAVSVGIESGFPRGAKRRSLGGRFSFWDAASPPHRSVRATVVRRSGAKFFAHAGHAAT